MHGVVYMWYRGAILSTANLTFPVCPGESYFQLHIYFYIIRFLWFQRKRILKSRENYYTF